jgi:MFS family permease
MATVFMTQLSVAVFVTLPFTTLVFLVQDLFPDLEESTISERTGFLASLSNLGMAVTSIPWGLVSDRRGRRPVLLVGAAASVTSVLALGLCSSYAGACAFRLAGGLLNGTLGSIKSLIADVTDASNAPQAFSILSVAWGIGAVLGPAAGGLLSRPCSDSGVLAASRHCQAGQPLLGRPYLLPCLFSALLCFIAGALAFKLPETLRRPDAADEESAALLKATPDAARPRWFRDRQCLLCLCGYTLTAYVYIQLDELIPLFAAAPRASGGLALSPRGLASPLAFGGAFVFVFSLYGYPGLVRSLGLRAATRLGFFATAAACVLVPACSLLGTASGLLLLPLVLAFRGAAAVTVFTSSMLLVNKNCPPGQLGEVNGCGQAAASLARGVGPAFAGLAWALCVRSRLPLAQFGAFCSVAVTTLTGGLGIYSRVRFDDDQEVTEVGAGE